VYIYACLNCKCVLHTHTQTKTMVLENGHTHCPVWMCACAYTHHDSITVIIIENIHCLLVSLRRLKTKTDRLANCQL